MRALTAFGMLLGTLLTILIVWKFAFFMAGQLVSVDAPTVIDKYDDNLAPRLEGRPNPFAGALTPPPVRHYQPNQASAPAQPPSQSSLLRGLTPAIIAQWCTGCQGRLQSLVEIDGSGRQVINPHGVKIARGPCTVSIRVPLEWAVEMNLDTSTRGVYTQRTGDASPNGTARDICEASIRERTDI